MISDNSDDDDDNKTRYLNCCIRPARRVPSKPGRPVAKCDGGIYMTVEWTRPEDDGGPDITAYIIKYGNEYIMHDEQYDTVKTVENTTYFPFTDQLEEKTDYRFAVAAENAAGQGEFSEFSVYVSTLAGKQCYD